jgi:hypothetical protein
MVKSLDTKFLCLPRFSLTDRHPPSEKGWLFRDENEPSKTKK